MNKVWGFIEVVCVIIILASTAGLVFSLGEPQGDGVYKMTERPPWLIYAGIGLGTTMVVGVFAYISRRSEGVSVKVRLFNTILLILFFGGAISLLNMFR
ncbi:hypothetical protein [Alkalihalobacillus sp. R86527]|uniref:hypothetical protein n=1 Tax=Alkalihalobacillus sp. R86527 TaxID=3093863 RepID=UPI00366C7AE4